MPGNRLAEGFVELSARSSLANDLSEARSQFKDTLESLDRDWLHSIRMRENAESNFLSKVGRMPRAILPQDTPKEVVTQLEQVRRNWELMEAAAARYGEAAARATARANFQPVHIDPELRETDLNRMRAISQTMRQESINRTQTEEALGKQRMAIILGEAEAMDTLVAAQVRATQAAGGGGSDAFRPMSQALAFQQAGISVRQYQQALIQLGYGIQDFAVMYGPMGFRGALQASINNFSMIAQSMGGPVKGAIIGTAATLVAVGISAWLSYKEAQEKAKQSTENLTKSLQNQQTVLESMSKLRQAKITGGGGGREGIASDLLGAENTLLEAFKKQEDLKKLLETTGKGLLPIRVSDVSIEEFNKFKAERLRELEPGHGFGFFKELGGTLPESVIKEMEREFAEKFGGTSLEVGPDTVRVFRIAEGEEAKKINERILEIQKEIEAGETSIAEGKAKVNALIKDRAYLEARVRAASSEYIYADSAERAAAVDLEMSKRKDAIMKLGEEGLVDKKTRDRMLEDLEADHRKRLGEIDTEEENRVFQEGDAANKAYSARADASRKRAVDLRRELKDQVEPGFKPIGDIFDRLDKRKEEIVKFKGVSFEEKADLLAGAERAKDAELDLLRKKLRPQASFSGIAEFEQKQQLSMLDSGQDEAIKKTAKFVELSNKELEKLNQKNFEGGFGP